MARNFINEDDPESGLSYRDGFRFGFGFFVANLLGITVLAVLGLIVAFFMHRLQ